MSSNILLNLPQSAMIPGNELQIPVLELSESIPHKPSYTPATVIASGVDEDIAFRRLGNLEATHSLTKEPECVPVKEVRGFSLCRLLYL